MKCMNPKCDSKEFSMSTAGPLIAGKPLYIPDAYWVTCNECGMAGPEGETSQEAKSYFEEKKNVKSEAYPTTPMSGPMSGVELWAKFNREKYVTPGVYLTIPSAWTEYVERIRSIKPLIVKDEMSEDFDSLAYAAWHSERMDRLRREYDIPKEVLEMKFGSEYSASREAHKLREQKMMVEAFTMAGVKGGLLMQDFIMAKLLDMELAKCPGGTVESLAGLGISMADPVIERNDLPPVPMEFYTPEGPGFTMPGFCKGKVLGIPFDMSKERGESPMMKQLRYRQSMGLDGPGWPKTPFSDIDIANGTPSTEREIEIQKPLTPGPTQITDSPVPEITAPTPNSGKAEVFVGGKRVSFDITSNDNEETITKKFLDAVKEQVAPNSVEPTINLANYPNKCNCGAPAYVGYTKIECTDPACKNWVKPKP